MPSQEPITPGQIKPESCREPETSSPFQQSNVNLQAPRNGVHGYTTGSVPRTRLATMHMERVARQATAGLILAGS